MATSNIFLDQRREKKDGTYPVKIMVRHKSNFSINTGVSVLPENIKIINGRVVSLISKGINKNDINSKLTQIENRIKTLQSNLKNLSDQQLKELLQQEQDEEKQPVSQIDFLDFGQKIVLDLINNDKDGTARWHKVTLSRLAAFRSPVYATDINYRFLVDFQEFLEQSGVREGINNYMRSLRSIFNQARLHYNDEDAGIIRIPQYPFGKYKIPTFKKKRAVGNSLTLEEMKLFINYMPSTPGEQYAKDIGVLMFCLIGINAKDLYYCKEPTGSRINYTRFKTGKEYSIKLEPEAKEILKRIKGVGCLLNAKEIYSDHLNFIHYTNIQLRGDDNRGYKNKNGKISGVKGIFKKIGINKRVTTNWFRHSWATIARNDCKISKDDVALCLGHEDQDNKVTDIYINYDPAIIDGFNRTVIDCVHKKPRNNT